MPASVKKLRAVESSAPAPSDVTVTPVQSAQDREAFIRFPYTLYAGDPNWVPPLEMERKDFLDPKKNAWFEFGSAELFLARRAGKVVGRIAGVSDPHWNDFNKTNQGAFGLFECIDDLAVARGLFDAATSWVKAQGHSELIGPLNFSTNYECAVLVEGFESPPAVMMTYNPRYYDALIKGCGFEKEKDLLAYELSSSVPPPERVVRIAEKIRQREGIVIRPVKMKDFAKEARLVKDIYNAAWEERWGFVPMTDREFDQLAKEMKAIIRPELVLIAEVNGEPVAFSLTVPDANFALRAAGGRLTRWGLPIGLVKLLLASRRIRRLRLILLGIKSNFRKRGIDAVLYLDTLLTAKRLGYSGGEISWTVEDAPLVNRSIEMMGGRKTKTYRVYRRAV
jgi:hypothetical protein